MLGVALVVSLLVACFGATEVGAPSASPGGTTLPLIRLSPVASGMLPVLVLASRMSSLEAAAGTAFRRLEAGLLVVAFLVSGLLMLWACMLASGHNAVPTTARALLAWFGLALLAGRLLGWRACWWGPCLALCVLVYWGYDSGRGEFRWWEFTAPGADPLPAWILSVGLLAAGAVAYGLTPWRGAALRERLRPRGGPVQASSTSAPSR